MQLKTINGGPWTPMEKAAGSVRGVYRRSLFSEPASPQSNCSRYLRTISDPAADGWIFPSVGTGL